MPFPYAYYKEYFNGPVHGWSFKGKALYLENANSAVSTSGLVDVKDRSIVVVNTSSSDVAITGFQNGAEGQVIFLIKSTSTNKMTISHNNAGQKIYFINSQDLIVRNSQFGGTVLYCVNDGGVLKWQQVDCNELFADGTAAIPSVSFASDQDTGIYKEGDNVLGFSTAGAKRVTISSTETYSEASIRTAGEFKGVATSAKWADLAERYYADKIYEHGTVVKLGGTCEITETTSEADANVFGIISNEPAFKMNDKLDVDITRNPFVAFAGRLPCKIVGKVKKGGRIVSSNIPGVARAMTIEDSRNLSAFGFVSFAVIGRALEDKNTEEVGLVEVVVGAK